MGYCNHPRHGRVVAAVIAVASLGIERIPEALVRQYVAGVPNTYRASNGVFNLIKVRPCDGSADEDGNGVWVEGTSTNRYNISVIQICYLGVGFGEFRLERGDVSLQCCNLSLQARYLILKGCVTALKARYLALKGTDLPGAHEVSSQATDHQSNDHKYCANGCPHVFFSIN